jgi:hydrogenase maturation protein HypF
VQHLCGVLDVQPQVVAHDLHPDFFSTRFALQLRAAARLPVLGVQHHHAHVAAVAAEHGMTGRCWGLALDGVGLGTDGAAWGGELLRVDGAECRRLGHLRDWRCPAATAPRASPGAWPPPRCIALGRNAEIRERFAEQQAAQAVAQMLAGDIHCPPTSSMGRMFDAAAGLLGIKAVMAYEGQAAMLLESMAQRYGDVLPLDQCWTISDGRLDLLPMLGVLADEKDAERGAALFHATLAAALADWLRVLAPEARTVVGSGGCFLNQVLMRGLRARLGAKGMQLVEARQVPPNDGGLSVGQAWVALQHLASQ